ncbi:MAG: SPASM domain-containing protein [Dissulfurispiraceae bacterium]|jgi:uncharacterized protein
MLSWSEYETLRLWDKAGQPLTLLKGCAGLIGRKDFCVGDLITGIRDYHLSHNLDNWKNEKCLACAYLPLCFGGCRYLKLVRDGEMKGVDCRKRHFDAVLEPLVKQDIAYKAQMKNIGND